MISLLLTHVSPASLLLGFGISRLWYAAPLIVSVSLVYSATRHEEMGPILRHAGRFAAWVVGFMAIVFVILYFVSKNL